MSPRVKYTGFKMPEPDFSSRITDLVMDLEFLRRRELQITTDPVLYEQLRNIFRDLDAIASARVDGNKTALAKFLEAKEENPDTKGRKTVEIDRLSSALAKIDQDYSRIVLTQGYFKALHKSIREDITKESTRHAGVYRRSDGRPGSGASHSAPVHMLDSYLEKLVAFMNKNYPFKYDAIKTAYAHLKFLWIHPFYEANGLMARLITYLLLKKQGFDGSFGRILNSCMGTCRDHEKYISLLRKADSGVEKDLNNWLEYALEGLRDALYQIDFLSDYDFLRKEILEAAFTHPLFDRIFTTQDRLIIDIALEKQVFQAADIRIYFPQKHPSEISKMLKWLKEKEMLINLEENSRKYAINLENKHLVKVLISKLDKKGYLHFEK
jgi:Fic family protein